MTPRIEVAEVENVAPMNIPECLIGIFDMSHLNGDL